MDVSSIVPSSFAASLPVVAVQLLHFAVSQPVLKTVGAVVTEYAPYVCCPVAAIEVAVCFALHTVHSLCWLPAAPQVAALSTTVVQL